MAAKKETFRVKAGPDAPDAVAHGNFEAEKVNGHYTTDNQRFAEFLDERYGSSTGSVPAKSKRKSKPKAKPNPADEDTAGQNDQEDLNNG